MTAIPHPKHPCPPKCPKRVGGCKITCEKWQDYEKEYEEFERQKTAEIVQVEAISNYKRRKSAEFLRNQIKHGKYKHP